MVKSIFLIAFSIVSISGVLRSQTSSVPFDWGWTSGTITRTVKVINGERVLDGPFSYTGVDKSPSKMVVKGNIKSGRYNGPFSLSWVCPSKDGFTYSAVGNFINDSLDGVWNFVERGFPDGKKTDRKYSLTFKKGMLIKAEINDLSMKGLDKFACDENGYLHGPVISREYENGYLVEKQWNFVHGLLVKKTVKDMASGSQLKVNSPDVDTTIFNNKNYNLKTKTFIKEGVVFEPATEKNWYEYLFTTRKYYLWNFVKQSYGGGGAEFIDKYNIRMPREVSYVKRVQ